VEKNEEYKSINYGELTGGDVPWHTIQMPKTDKLITITLEEYKELLEYKGRYFEAKERNLTSPLYPNYPIYRYGEYVSDPKCETEKED
jgi:hypothetical protein